MQKDDLSLLIIANGHRVYPQVRQLFGHRGQFVVVGGKKGTRASYVMQVFNDGAGDGQTIIRARASADFVKDNQAVLRCMVKDRRGLFHLDHKGAFSRGDVILGANTGKNAVDQSDTRAACGHKTARSALRG